MSAEADIIDIDRSRPSFGQWSDEASAAAEFDRRITKSGLFRSYAEVRGFYLSYRPNREGKDARIDRVLVPTADLVRRGWRRCIGIEIKRSDEKVGKPLAQAIDYTHCAWNLADNENEAKRDDLPSMWMMVENVFLWPFPKQSRALESVMLQNGVGVVYEQPRAPLIFQLDRQVIRINDDGTVNVQVPQSGTKMGSR
jgi:hypothetical protein